MYYDESQGHESRLVSVLSVIVVGIGLTVLFAASLVLSFAWFGHVPARVVHLAWLVILIGAIMVVFGTWRDARITGTGVWESFKAVLKEIVSYFFMIF